MDRRGDPAWSPAETVGDTNGVPASVNAGGDAAPPLRGQHTPTRNIAGGFVAWLALIALLSLPIVAQRRPQQHPRLANLFLKWHLSEEEARDLARWDVIILDMEVVENTPEAFALLRQLAPEAKIFAYVTSQEIRRDAAVHPQTPLRNRLAARVDDAWYLRAATGDRVAWWPQTWLLNMSDRRWTDALAGFVASEISRDSRWDGIYFDNLWGGISWFDRAPIDLNGDGRAEDGASLNAAWVAGTRGLLAETRSRTRSGFLITGNGDATYADLVNGILLEHFPKTAAGDWSASMRAYARVLERAMEPVIAIVNVNTGNTGVTDPRAFRFGLTSALLAGGYFSYDFGDLDHAQRWWFQEYETFLGEPRSDAERITDVAAASTARTAVREFLPGVYRRDYERGLVLVNATDTPRTLRFDEEFEEVAGSFDPQEPRRIVSDITVAPQDGAILLRPLDKILAAPFVNGVFARVFRHDGRVARNGFFAYTDGVRGGVTMEQRDLDSDGDLETIIADGATIRVRRDGSEVRAFTPFGDQYRGTLAFVIGDLDRNGTWEIVVAQRDRGALLGIFNLLEGRLLSPYAAPFGARWTRGMTVALARRTSGARPDIIVGAGSGVSPEVRVLDWKAKPTGERFLAYDAKFRGSVRVAGGDTDGDGRDEIVVGAGPGGGPHVRVFSGTDHALVGEFFAFASDRRSGVDVAVVDLDGNGVGEILGMSTSVFSAASP